MSFDEQIFSKAINRLRIFYKCMSNSAVSSVIADILAPALLGLREVLGPISI